MNIKHKISTTLVFASLALGALPAGAVSYHSSYSRNKTDGIEGTEFRIMPTFAGHFCYLSKVEVENTDIKDETAACRVTTQSQSWVLTATLGKSSDAKVRCRAICYNN
jgi:hypothetical protein